MDYCRKMGISKGKRPRSVFLKNTKGSNFWQVDFSSMEGREEELFRLFA